jgi:hypothetical protein
MIDVESCNCTIYNSFWDINILNEHGQCTIAILFMWLKNLSFNHGSILYIKANMVSVYLFVCLSCKAGQGRAGVGTGAGQGQGKAARHFRLH